MFHKVVKLPFYKSNLVRAAQSFKVLKLTEKRYFADLK
jgi:hypothetical protein